MGLAFDTVLAFTDIRLWGVVSSETKESNGIRNKLEEGPSCCCNSCNLKETEVKTSRDLIISFPKWYYYCNYQTHSKAGYSYSYCSTRTGHGEGYRTCTVGQKWGYFSQWKSSFSGEAGEAKTIFREKWECWRGLPTCFQTIERQLCLWIFLSLGESTRKKVRSNGEFKMT